MPDYSNQPNPCNNYCKDPNSKTDDPPFMPFGFDGFDGFNGHHIFHHHFHHHFFHFNQRY